MFEFFSKPKAVIIRTDMASNDVDVSADIPSVPQANAIQAATINAEKGVPLSRDTNDFDGHVTTALVPQDANQTIYHKIIYETIPTSEL